ncbi:MAG: M48 family metalloprotease [Kofleriaceae bacterium]
MRALALVGLAACGAPASYLGAETPAACTSSDPERCASALAERDLIAGELDAYDDTTLRGYVQGISDRLARTSRLARAPHVVISNHDGTYAPFGNAIVIGRVTIEKLGSEAELAAVIAHEMAHIEGHHATVSLFGPNLDKEWLATRRDAEGIADERAIALLELAGYSPSAMPRALQAELDSDDDEHPPRADRIARIAALASNRTGFEGRDELLHQVDHMVVGRDTRLGIAVGKAWVIANLDLAIDLPYDDDARSRGDGLVLRHGDAELSAYAIGAPWARELASQLERRETSEGPLGRVTVGIARERTRRTNEPLERLEDAVRATLPQPVPGQSVVIIERCIETVDTNQCGGLVIELDDRDGSNAQKRWLGALRDATPREVRLAQPARIVLATATRGGRVERLAAACPNPTVALTLDDPARQIAAGEPFKCTDR